MAEVAVCDRCGEKYPDKESVDLAKKWIADGYAPCPNLYCTGQLVIREELMKFETNISRMENGGVVIEMRRVQ